MTLARGEQLLHFRGALGVVGRAVATTAADPPVLRVQILQARGHRVDGASRLGEERPVAARPRYGRRSSLRALIATLELAVAVAVAVAISF